MPTIGKKTKRLLGIILSICAFYAVLEMGIRYTGIYAQLSEKNGNGFLSLFHPTHHGIFQNYEPFDTVYINNTEFSYVHAMDANGFRNNPLDADTNVVLALGDSFTEGLGAAQDSSWPAILQNKIQRPVYNAGVMGGDPVFGYKILTENHFKFKPSTVIFAINFSDIADIVIRGGKERFLSDGSLKYEAEPWFMSIYKMSHTFRAIIHLLFKYDYMFNSPSNREEHLNKALETISETLFEANTYCKNRNIKMYVFVHPVPQEYYKHLDSRLDFKLIDRLVPVLESKNIQAINLRRDFEKALTTPEAWKNVSWFIDGHFNAKGYALMAQLIADKLNEADHKVTKDY